MSAVAAWSMSADLSSAAKEPQTLRWRSGVIRIGVSTSLTSPNTSIKADSDVLSALRRSLATWQSVTGLEFRIESSDKLNVSPAGTTGDGVSLVTIAPTSDNLQLFGKDPLGESARTRVFYDRRGAITEGDIVLNPLQQFSTDGTFGTFDLETTLTHEIGHLLGLRHSALASSMMAERIPRNSDLMAGPRQLSDSDVAAIRDLYRQDAEDGSCCGAVTGRLSTGTRPAKNVTVWAEDSAGRVAGQGQIDSDGLFRIGGLSDAKYSLLALRRDPDGTTVFPVGSVSVAENDRSWVSKRFSADGSGFSLELLGVGSTPSEAAVNLRQGRQYTLSVFAKGSGDVLPEFTFSTSAIRVVPSSVSADDRSGNGSLIHFTLTVDYDALPGVYTLYGQKGDARSALVGAVVITK